MRITVHVTRKFLTLLYRLSVSIGHMASLKADTCNHVNPPSWCTKGVKVACSGDEPTDLKLKKKKKKKLTLKSVHMLIIHPIFTALDFLYVICTILITFTRHILFRHQFFVFHIEIINVGTSLKHVPFVCFMLSGRDASDIKSKA